MKLTYKVQTIIAIVMILLANILTEIFASWIFRSVGFVICGLLWIIHPVIPDHLEVSKETVFWTRIGGVILILIGVFTRVHL